MEANMTVDETEREPEATTWDTRGLNLLSVQPPHLIRYSNPSGTEHPINLKRTIT